MHSPCGTDKRASGAKPHLLLHQKELGTVLILQLLRPLPKAKGRHLPRGLGQVFSSVLTVLCVWLQRLLITAPISAEGESKSVCVFMYVCVLCVCVRA